MRGKVLLSACFLALIFSPLAQAQPDSVQTKPENKAKTYAKYFLEDALRIGAAPVWWNEGDWLKFGAVTAGTGLLVWQDDEIRNAFQRNRTHTTNRIANRFTPFGAAGIAQPVLIGIFAGATVFKEKKLQALALDGWEASYFALTATSLLKAATSRARPFEEKGVWKRTGFSTGSSFPSGHTTQAFVLAAVASGHFPKTWVKVLSYGLAAGVGLARMNDDKHFASDVLVGAALGYSVGWTIFKRNEKRRQKNFSRR